MKKPKSFSNLSKISTGILQEQAAAYLASGSYKLTQEIYKILLKREDNPRYRQGLAECYLQRSLAVAEQGKFKEAITHWENSREYVDLNTANEQYISWLLKVGQQAKIKTYLQSLPMENLHNDYPQLALSLGYFHVTGQINLLQYLPEHAVLALQGDHAQQALLALQQNDVALMQQHLTKIPFRSAYRDFRTLLKAASLVFSGPNQANDLLLKIGQDSPYYPASRLFAVLPLTGKALSNALLNLSNKQQRIIAKAKDWKDQQIKLLQTISRQKQPLTDKKKFALAIQYQQLLGDDYAQRFCLALLPVYPAGKRLYEKNFGALDKFETLRISALCAETKQNYYQAINNWDQCLELLYEDKQQNSLKIAFILRHMAKLCTPEEAIDFQIESLEFDAEDRETHLHILKYYEQNEEQNKYKQRLAETLALFPKDIAMLGQAMQAAIRNNAFKKATQYADKILAIDPVNTQAKQVLFYSHLNHARKLLRNEKFHLVEKEIRQAEKLNLGKDFPALAQMLYGFFVYLYEDKASGGQLIEKSRKSSAEGDFISRFRIINEALLLDIPLTPLLRQISPLAEDYELSNGELHAFIKLLDAQQKEGNSVIVKALDKTKKDFKRLIKQQRLNQDQSQIIMQQLEKFKHYELMRHCLNCTPDIKGKPLGVFYKTYLEAKGNPAEVPPFEIAKLQLQFSNAENQGDPRTAALISRFLDKIYQLQQKDYSEPVEDDFFDPYGALFEHIDNRTFSKIDRKIDQLQNTLVEDKLLSALIEMLPDKKLTSLLLMDMNIFDALLFLKAAQELDIDINVTVENILDIAQDNSGASFPFAF